MAETPADLEKRLQEEREEREREERAEEAARRARDNPIQERRRLRHDT